MSKLLDNVVTEFAKLPGVGSRTALRLALHLLRQDQQNALLLADAVRKFRLEVRHCRYCNNISDEEVCPICADPERDRSTICIVEQVKDVMSIEHTRQYHGLYHVLGGVISPMEGISPSDLKIDLLLENIERIGVKEVILALGTTVEGETTSFYITRKLEMFNDLKITAIARGIGFGDELEYADEMTITHALMNRRPL